MTCFWCSSFLFLRSVESLSVDIFLKASFSFCTIRCPIVDARLGEQKHFREKTQTRHMNLTVPHEIVHEKIYFYFDVNISFSSFPFRCKLIIFKMYLFCKWPHRFLFILSANIFVPQMEAKSGPLFFIIVRRSKFLDYLRRFMLLRKTKKGE